MTRRITFLNILYIYFNTAPFIFGELSLIFGITALTADKFNTENLVLGIVLTSIGLYFTFKKFRVLKRAMETIKFGDKTTSTLAWIIDSNYRHNQRVVKTYIFNYHVNNNTFTYEFSSAYKRHLNTGMRMDIYYLPSNPQYSFIPELYNAEVK